MFQPGQILGSAYKIIELLGEGGMGAVFKAVDQNLERKVAIKVLTENASLEDHLAERFVREGKLLATVKHPNVLEVYAAGTDGPTGRTYLVMELVDGHTLKELLPKIRGDQRAIPALFQQMLEGIRACHRKDIIHRDLKPANIMITRSGVVKIFDFGIAKTAEALTRTGMTVGTPYYMSPEQCRGTSDLTPSSDVYSLGIILWEMIFGEPPFTARDTSNPELAIALQHVQGTLPVVALPEEGPLCDVLPVLRRMLDKEPSARPDLEYLLRVFSALQRGEPIPAQAAASVGPTAVGSLPGELPADSIARAGAHPTDASATAPSSSDYLSNLSERARPSEPPSAREDGDGVGLWIMTILLFAVLAGGTMLVIRSGRTKGAEIRDFQPSVATFAELPKTPSGSATGIPMVMTSTGQSLPGGEPHISPPTGTTGVSLTQSGFAAPDPAAPLKEVFRADPISSDVSAVAVSPIPSGTPGLTPVADPLEVRRKELIQAIDRELQTLRPPASPDNVLALLSALAEDGRAAEDAQIRRRQIFTWYELYLDEHLASDPLEVGKVLGMARRILPGDPEADQKISAIEKKLADSQVDMLNAARTKAENPDQILSVEFPALLSYLEQSGKSAEVGAIRHAAIVSLEKAALATDSFAGADLLLERMNDLFPPDSLEGRLMKDALPTRKERVQRSLVASFSSRILSQPAPRDAEEVIVVLTELQKAGDTSLVEALAAHLRASYVEQAKIVGKENPEAAMGLLEEALSIPMLADDSGLKQFLASLALRKSGSAPKPPPPPESPEMKALRDEVAPMLTRGLVEQKASDIRRITHEIKRLGSPEKARDLTYKAVKLLLEMALDREKAGDRNGASQAYKAALVIIPNHSRTVMNLARLEGREGPSAPTAATPAALPTEPSGDPTIPKMGVSELEEKLEIWLEPGGLEGRVDEILAATDRLRRLGRRSDANRYRQRAADELVSIAEENGSYGDLNAASRFYRLALRLMPGHTTAQTGLDAVLPKLVPQPKVQVGTSPESTVKEPPKAKAPGSTKKLEDSKAIETSKVLETSRVVETTKAPETSTPPTTDSSPKLPGSVGEILARLDEYVQADMVEQQHSAIVQLCNALQKKGKQAAARKYRQQAAQELVSIAEENGSFGDLKGAARFYKLALQVNPGDTAAKEGLAVVQEKDK